jgi:hypothetical protein
MRYYRGIESSNVFFAVWWQPTSTCEQRYRTGNIPDPLFIFQAVKKTNVHVVVTICSIQYWVSQIDQLHLYLIVMINMAQQQT